MNVLLLNGSPRGGGNTAIAFSEMAKIAAMDQQKRYYHSTPEILKRYAEMVPDVDGQK